MTKLFVDASLDAQLTNLREPAELCDHAGRILGFFHPVARPLDASAASPFSDEEIARQREQRQGSPLAEVLERLNNHGLRTSTQTIS